MSKVSVIIPCREEPYLAKTVTDLLAKAAGDVEVIVVLDGPQEFFPRAGLPNDRRIIVLQHEKMRGRRAATNTAVRAATGKYLMKIDAHCMIGESWDKILAEDCADNWIMAPKFYNLDAPNWIRMEKPKPVDAMRFLYPYQNPYKPKFCCRPWPERSAARKDVLIDEDMGCDGSLWFMHKSHWERLGEMDETGYGTFVNEPEEICLKTQLGPWEGKVMRNKKIWYAHWSKFISGYWNRTAEGVGWLTYEEWVEGFGYGADYWWHNRWPGRKHDIEWLIDKFWPLPGWPQDWRTRETVQLEYAR